MSRLRRAMVAATIGLAAGPGWAAGDAARGALVAEARCAPCHFLDRTTRKIGPGLKGVFGRAPTIDGVPFARWDARALDRWLTNPRAVKPNTKMQIPPLAPRDRADVIAYLRTLR